MTDHQEHEGPDAQRPPVEKNRSSPVADKDHWEKDLIARIALAGLAEQRRARRWGIFFKSAALLYLVVLLGVLLVQPGAPLVPVEDHTALVDVKGVIADDSDANADRIVSGLRAAFEAASARGVIVRINSPGGSPVQAGYINDEIKRLKKMHPDKPVYAVIEDICASGGYYIAVAADAIYADKASLVGSIGVLMNGFGFTGTMEKLGVERRLITAGENKGFLDPFSPLQKAHVEHMRRVLKTTHQQFIRVVQEGRGDRLADDDRIFSGLIWTGEQGLELGLVDQLGSAGYVAREVIGAERIVDYTPKLSPLERFSQQLGATLGNVLAEVLLKREVGFF